MNHRFLVLQRMDARKILESKAEDKKEIACYRGTALRFLNNIVSIYRARRVEEKLISRRFQLKSKLKSFLILL